MKTLSTLLFLLSAATASYAAGSMVTYTVAGETFEGYYTSPSADAPLVLLIHDWDGLNGYEVKRAEMLADLGYAVFAADMYGKGVRPTELKDKQDQTNRLYQDRARMRTLLQGALAEAKTLGAHVDNAVAMGYCFGGAVVLELARSGEDLKGFVTFHGGLATPEGQDYAKTKGKVLVFHGSADTYVTLTDFANLAAALEKYHIPHEMTTYGGAPHAFTVFDTPAYRKEADEQSWTRFVSFLNETLR